MQNALIILSGGIGKRLSNNQNIPKQYIKIGSTNIIEYFLENLEKEIFDIIVIVCKKKMKNKYLDNLRNNFNWHNIYITESGYNRQESSKKGVYFLKKFMPKKILIHDAARPLANNKLIKRIIYTLDKYKSCAPYTINHDYIKCDLKKYNLNENKIKFIQTPQGFIYKRILKAHIQNNNFNAKDDTILTENIGIKTKLIKGDKKNIKITVNDDFKILKLLKNKITRSGIGYDVHKIDYNSKKKLLLCGVKIQHYPLIGHSDADVGYHAICDSILGALSMKDIGYYFNNKNPKWKNVNSTIFLKFCFEKLKMKKFNILNLDINFICEKPNIRKYANKMKKNISKILNIKINQISIKATTNEKIGFIGKGEGIAAESIIQISHE